MSCLWHETPLSKSVAWRASWERAKVQLGIISHQRHEQGRNIWYWALGG
jgi:hypothetical protein